MTFRACHAPILRGAVACCAAVLLGLVGVAWAEVGVTPTEVHLGQVCALSGPARSLGQGMEQGLKLYFDKTNATGGVRGRRIKLTTVDDGYEPRKTFRAAEKLIAKEGVFALIGGVGTPTSKVTVPICEEYAVPYIGPFTGAEFLRNPFKKQVVNFRASYFQEMERLSQHLVDELGFRRIACFYQNDAYGQAGLTGLEQALERRSLRVVSKGAYRRNTSQVQRGLSAIAPSQPEAVVMVGAYGPCSAFIHEAKGLPQTKDAVFCNISFVGAKALHLALGDDAEGCIVSQVVPFPWDRSVAVVDEYHTDMAAAGAEGEIGFVSLEGYLAGKLFVMTLQRVNGELTRASFLSAITNTGRFDLGGIVLTFGPEDHQGMDQVFLTKFTGGKIVPIP